MTRIKVQLIGILIFFIGTLSLQAQDNASKILKEAQKQAKAENK